MMDLPEIRHGNTALYAGTFDPVTNGHIWVMEKGMALFDHLYIAVSENPAKKTMFTAEERLAMIEHYLRFMGYSSFATPFIFQNAFIANAAGQLQCNYMLRGIRNATDFGYEKEIQDFNTSIQPTIETIFVSPPKALSSVSSSLIRGCVGLDGWEHILQDYTTPHVLNELKEKHLVRNS